MPKKCGKFKFREFCSGYQQFIYSLRFWLITTHPVYRSVDENDYYAWDVERQDWRTNDEIWIMEFTSHFVFRNICFPEENRHLDIQIKTYICCFLSFYFVDFRLHCLGMLDKINFQQLFSLSFRQVTEFVYFQGIR